MSFFLVKLLQNFDSITFDSESFDPETLPPAEWSTFPGRKGKDKFWPKAHLTLYPAVSARSYRANSTADRVIFRVACGLRW